MHASWHEGRSMCVYMCVIVWGQNCVGTYVSDGVWAESVCTHVWDSMKAVPCVYTFELCWELISSWCYFGPFIPLSLNLWCPTCWVGLVHTDAFCRLACVCIHMHSIGLGAHEYVPATAPPMTLESELISVLEWRHTPNWISPWRCLIWGSCLQPRAYF